MNDQELKNALLQTTQTLNDFIVEQRAFNKKQEETNKKQEVFNNEQRATNLNIIQALGSINDFMIEQQKFNARQEEFNARQEEFNARQEEFNDKLWIVIENELMDKLAFFADDSKMYADKKLLNHEERFRHTPAFV